MFRRGLAVLLCSALLAGSLPETSFAAENAETVETAETETAQAESEEAEPEKQENDASTESGEAVQASQTAVPETQTVSGTEKTETATVETTEAGEASTTEVKTDASEETTQTATAAETETTTAVETETVTETTTAAETETVTETATAVETETATVTETTTETEETTTIVETEEATTEVETEEATTEVETEEIENAEEQASDATGNEDVTVSNVVVTYDSISFDYEVKNSNVQYVRLDGFEGYRYLSSEGSVKIDGLNPSTEYNIYFTNESEGKRKYYEFSRTTEASPYDVELLTPQWTDDGLKVTAKITAKEGAKYELPSAFMIDYVLYDNDGNRLDYDIDYASVSSLPAEITYDIYSEPCYMFGNTAYTLEASIVDYDLNFSLGAGMRSKFWKGNKSFTTEPSKVSVAEMNFNKDESVPTTSNYTLTTGDYKEPVNVTLYTRIKGSGDRWDSNCLTDEFTTDAGTYTGSLRNLSLGTTYEYLLNVGGLKKTGEFTHGESKLKWELSSDVGAFDTVATLRIDNNTKTEGATYEVYSDVKFHSGNYWYDGEYLQEDTDAGIYQYMVPDLYPNTAYDIKFEITETLSDGSRNLYTVIENVTTKESAVVTKNVRTYLNAVIFEIAYAPSVRTDYIYEGQYVYPYIKNQDGKYIRLSDNGMYIGKDTDSYRWGRITGLESNKSYEVFFCYYDDEGDRYYEYGSQTFRTPADDRKITVDTPEAGVTSLTVKGTFTGKALPYEESTYVVLLYKESGSEKWQRGDVTSVDYDGEKFSLSAYIDAGKSYDYAVGIGDSNAQSITELKSVKTGTVTLNPDERSVEVTETISLLDGVVVKAKLSGRYIDDYNEACMLYREAGKADASWNQTWIGFDGDERESYSIIRNYNGEALKVGDYEYKLCMTVPEKEEDYAALPGGTFKYEQQTDDRKLTVSVAEKRNAAVLNINYEGTVSAITNYIIVFYREKGSESWLTSGSMDISWNNSQSARTWDISGLTSDTEYEYTVGISNEYKYIFSVDDIVAGKQEGTFKTTDTRTLGTPVVRPSYSSVEVDVDVDGIASNDYDYSYVCLYTKDPTQQNASWIQKVSAYIGRTNNRAELQVVSLEPGKTYEYALVISDNNNGITPDSEEFNKLPDGRKFKDTFTTNKSDYKLEIEANAEKSVFDTEVLNLKVTSASAFNEKNFEAALDLYEVEGSNEIPLGRRFTVSINSIDYSAEAEIPRLDAGKTYKVKAKLAAFVITNSGAVVSSTRETVGEAECVFTTKAAAAPTELKPEEEQLWLNSWDSYHDEDYIYIPISNGFSSALNWVSSNPDVAEIDEYDTYTKGAYAKITAGIPGEAVITATSVLDPTVKAEITVHVADYGVVLTDTTPATPVSVVSILKNKYSGNAVYAKLDRATSKYEAVKAVGTSENPNIAYWDSDGGDNKLGCVVAKNAGMTYIDLEADGYKTRLYVIVTADSPDLTLSISPGEGEDVDYPALKQEDGSYQIAYGNDEAYYWVSVNEIDDLPYGIGDAIRYTSSAPKILEVDEKSGYVEGKAPGTAMVTVTYDMKEIAELSKKYSQLAEIAKEIENVKVEIKFDVKPIAPTSIPQEQPITAITNIHKTLGDVKLIDGWTWREPSTPLYSLPTNGNDVYSFDVVGTGFYSNAETSEYVTTAQVAISTFADIDVENTGRNVISGDGKDSMNLWITPVIYGYQDLKEGSYTVEFPSVPNVTVTKDEDGSYKVTASQKGKYTLKPEIKVDGTTAIAGSYTFTAVDGTLVDHIELIPKTENKNVTIKGSTIYFNTAAGVTDFDLEAKAYDSENKEITDAKLAWTTTDKSVADVKATGKDAKVTIKSDGHAVIRVTAGDAAKVSSIYKLEARNYKPRVEGDKVTINTAYDYSNGGTDLSAAQYGVISIASVYGVSNDDVQVVSADVEDGAKNLNGKVSKEFKVEYVDNEEEYEDNCVIAPVNPDMAAGKYNVKLAVTTEPGFIYTYPLTVTVIKKQPKVSVKVANSMNLFYLNEKGYLDITLEKNKSKGTDFEIENIQWSNNVDGGFKLSRSGDTLPKTPNVERYSFDGSKVKVTNGKLANPAVATGTVKIKLSGVRESYNPSVTVKYSYKKPKLTTADAMTGKNVSTIIPSANGGSTGMFRLYADKTLLRYNSNAFRYTMYYNKYQCGNNDVEIIPGSRYTYNISFAYSGTAEQFDVPVTVDSYYWREPLTATHKVKAVKPVAVLRDAKLTYNTNYDSAVSTYVYLKDYIGYVEGESAYNIISTVDVNPADEASRELMANDKLQISTYGGSVTAKLNPSKLGAAAPKGATYVLTPYYRDSATGERKELNKVTLKISFTNKKVTAKASGKGKLDLAVGYRTYEGSDFSNDGSYTEWLAFNSITVAPKFANLGSGYSVESAKLTGEYSKYFELYYEKNHYAFEDKKGNSIQYIKISNNGVGKLKAGHNYNLYVTYTLKDNNGGGTIVVKSNVLKIKPVQKAPKITVVGNNRSLYMASPELTRRCEIRTPYYGTRLDKNYYEVEDAYGALDTNKDGKADIVITLYDTDNSEGKAYLEIQLTEAGKHAVVAGPKGKAYTVPVTVTVTGRDGITKDAVVKVKVTVKK